MKRLCAAVLAFALTLVIISALTYSASPAAIVVETCSCTASDESCSASISCKGGCQQFCGKEGDCWAQCSGGPGDLGTATSVEMQNGTYPELVAELERISLRKIDFTPTNPDTTLNISFKQASLWDAFEFLSDRGTLRIGGHDFESLRKLRKVLLSGGRTSLSVKNTPVNTFVNDMAFVTGLPLRIVVGRPNAPVNIDLQDVTLADILNKVSKLTGTKIREGGL